MTYTFFNKSNLQRGVRDQIHITYNTYLPDVFDVPKYAKTLNEIVKKKSTELKLLRNLKSVDVTKREATFEILGEQGKRTGEVDVQQVLLFSKVEAHSSNPHFISTRDKVHAGVVTFIFTNSELP